MVLLIFGTVIVHGTEMRLDAEIGGLLQDLARFPSGTVGIPRGGAGRRKEGVVHGVGGRDAAEGVDRLGIAPPNEISAAEVAPEALRVIGVEPHRLPDPV